MTISSAFESTALFTVIKESNTHSTREVLFLLVQPLIFCSYEIGPQITLHLFDLAVSFRKGRPMSWQLNTFLKSSKTPIFLSV